MTRREDSQEDDQPSGCQTPRDFNHFHSRNRPLSNERRSYRDLRPREKPQGHERHKRQRLGVHQQPQTCSVVYDSDFSERSEDQFEDNSSRYEPSTNSRVGNGTPPSAIKRLDYEEDEHSPEHQPSPSSQDVEEISHGESDSLDYEEEESSSGHQSPPIPQVVQLEMDPSSDDSAWTGYEEAGKYSEPQSSTISESSDEGRKKVSHYYPARNLEVSTEGGDDEEGDECTPSNGLIAYEVEQLRMTAYLHLDEPAGSGGEAALPSLCVEANFTPGRPWTTVQLHPSLTTLRGAENRVSLEQLRVDLCLTLPGVKLTLLDFRSTEWVPDAEFNGEVDASLEDMHQRFSKRDPGWKLQLEAYPDDGTRAGLVDLRIFYTCPHAKRKSGPCGSRTCSGCYSGLEISHFLTCFNPALRNVRHISNPRRSAAAPP